MDRLIQDSQGSPIIILIVQCMLYLLYFPILHQLTEINLY